MLHFALSTWQLSWLAQTCILPCPVEGDTVSGHSASLIYMGSHADSLFTCSVHTWLTQPPIGMSSLVYNLPSCTWLAQYAVFFYLRAIWGFNQYPVFTVCSLLVCSFAFGLLDRHSTCPVGTWSGQLVLDIRRGHLHSCLHSYVPGSICSQLHGWLSWRVPAWFAVDLWVAVNCSLNLFTGQLLAQWFLLLFICSVVFCFLVGFHWLSVHSSHMGGTGFWYTCWLPQ